jgi:hypothetical protein
MKHGRAILTLVAVLFVSARAANLESLSDTPYWSFQAVKRPASPVGEKPIDAFITAKLKGAALAQNPPATRRELIRRAYFDLIGLPPTPEEVSAFEWDDSPDAFELVLDRLLASPHYGERWGRHWLDVVRFAQSNGYERDGEKLLAWRYRDYVIKAFNEDKPYDRFVTEQIAGDELPDGTADTVAATAFQRLGVFDDEPDDKRMAEFDALDDVVATTGTTFLGLTLGCARCHDHKFDPIRQADYYSFLAFFRGVRPFESTTPGFDSPGFTPLAGTEEIRHWRAWKNSRLKTLEEERMRAPDEKKRKQIEAEIKKTKEDVPYEWTLAVSERGRECPATHILTRGNAATPNREVEPAFPQCLTKRAPKFPEPPPDALTSGRRRVLAEWMASSENPLTARVMVNRVWQHHFGEGLVKTPSDFGRAGATPSHPELLDWLAAEFMETGWSLKKLHKLIMLSATYQQSSRAENERAMAVDPGNRLLWRQNAHRLEAEALRDTMLAVSGSLNTRMAGRGFFPHLAGEVLAGQSRPGLDWDVSGAGEQARRSVYAFVRRTMGVPLFEAFDYNNTTSPLAERSVTTVAPQALMLLNADFMQQQASHFATRVAGERDPSAEVKRAYAIAFNRSPSQNELRTGMEFLRRNEQNFCALARRTTFQLDVPNALSTEYFAKLTPAQFYEGPREGWSYFRGEWAPPYEGIRVAVREQAPFALWDGMKFKDGTIEANVLFSKSTESAGLLFCAKAEKERARGYELVLMPRRNKLELRQHDGTTRTVASVETALATGRPFGLKIAVAENRIQVWVDSRAVLDFPDATRVEAGQIGVRAWGGPMSLDNLSVTVGGEKKEISSENTNAKRSALEAFCLLLLNLNELIYID